MQNATYLTQKWQGRGKGEDHIWTPCFCEFLRFHTLKLPISECPDILPDRAPYYTSRRRDPDLLISRDDKILAQPGQRNFLSEIKTRFPQFNEQDPGRHPDGKDIAGIEPDLLIIPGAKSQGPNARVYLIENKPYDTFNPTGNQEAGGAYSSFVKWLNKSGVLCQYLLIQSIGIGWEDYKKVHAIQKGLACCRFQRHRVRCMNETGGGAWSGASLRESLSWRP